MAESGSGADNSGDCVNLLYNLASKRRELSDTNNTFKTSDGSSSGDFNVNMETETSQPTELPTSLSQPGSSGTAANTPGSDALTLVNRLTKPSSTSSDDRRICPKVNCPEKIILCLDVSKEMEKVTFRSRAGDWFSPIKLIKRAVGIFVHSKHRLNPDHEFALILVKERAIMLHDFTNNPEKIIAILQELDNCFSVDTCDLSTLFDTIQQGILLPNIQNPKETKPPYVVRTVLIYGRSHCMPEMIKKESFHSLMSSPYFYLDIFYVHESPSHDNRCEAVFDAFCKLDVNGQSYIFEVSRNPTKVYDCMAQLLPHPLQRPMQEQASFTISAKS